MYKLLNSRRVLRRRPVRNELPASNRPSSRIETRLETVLWKRRRLRCLSRGDEEAQALADRLESCSASDPCRSGACHVCARQERTDWCREIASLFDGSAPLSAVSLVSPLWSRGTGELCALDLRKVRDQLRSQFRRSALENAAAVGGIDFSFNLHSAGEWEPHWQAHAYVIVEGFSPAEASKALERFYPKTREIPRPIRAREVQELLPAASYSFKSMFSRRVSYVDPHNGRQNTRLLSLKPRQERVLSVFLDQQPRHARLFTRNILRKAGKLVRR